MTFEIENVTNFTENEKCNKKDKERSLPYFDCSSNKTVIWSELKSCDSILTTEAPFSNIFLCKFNNDCGIAFAL